ncbi:MAG TPA: DRTGG domain-containing protein [Anaerolineaceae bacterium]|nr:DRTGG domain-containing protein [Anaerolineaceae bacterium]HPN50293.1 DRTGG domain-containing protein [Anaerolineaceae bacterium]
MKIVELVKLVNGTVLVQGDRQDRDIKGGFGADLMSDVLASIQPDAVLLTGLCNPQVVRTAQVADVAAIVFVRGKNPPIETIRLADQEGIPLISSPYGMFELAGRLYKAGLPSFEKSVDPDCSCE